MPESLMGQVLRWRFGAYHLELGWFRSHASGESRSYAILGALAGLVLWAVAAYLIGMGFAVGICCVLSRI